MVCVCLGSVVSDDEGMCMRLLRLVLLLDLVLCLFVMITGIAEGIWKSLLLVVFLWEVESASEEQ